jgi:isoquinoline 1-oxidoreductase alpha subunit
MIRFKVNGLARTYDGDPEMPLLWYLRDIAGFTGTKFGCGMSLCGACTVHQNGAAVRSCSVAMRAVSGTSITTIEGICAKGLHPVQKAWMQIKVPQCGYCQTGQIMQAIVLLNQNKNPSDPEIDQAMSGNLCRCGTYQRIRAAIHQAAKEMA